MSWIQRATCHYWHLPCNFLALTRAFSIRWPFLYPSFLLVLRFVDTFLFDALRSDDFKGSTIWLRWPFSYWHAAWGRWLQVAFRGTRHELHQASFKTDASASTLGGFLQPATPRSLHDIVYLNELVWWVHRLLLFRILRRRSHHKFFLHDHFLLLLLLLTPLFFFFFIGDLNRLLHDSVLRWWTESQLGLGESDVFRNLCQLLRRFGGKLAHFCILCH